MLIVVILNSKRGSINDFVMVNLHGDSTIIYININLSFLFIVFLLMKTFIGSDVYLV